MRTMIVLDDADLKALNKGKQLMLTFEGREVLLGALRQTHQGSNGGVKKGFKYPMEPCEKCGVMRSRGGKAKHALTCKGKKVRNAKKV